MLRKLITIVLFICMAITVNAATNARTAALGNAWVIGDITLVANQGWQTLSYPDQIQASLAGGKSPGSVFLIKSFGESMAIGITANTVDNQTKGSVLASKEFVADALSIGAYDPTNLLYNLPQYHFGIKIGEHKIGIDAFYEQWDKNENTVQEPDSNTAITSNYKKSVYIGNIGGQLSARLAFNKLAINPWFKYGFPITKSEFNYQENSAGNELRFSRSFKQDKKTKMLLTGLSLDYDFGDVGWAIVSFGYRKECFGFIENSSYDTTGSIIRRSVYSGNATALGEMAAKYNNNFYSYFIAYSPKLPKDIFLAFEYHGGKVDKEVDYFNRPADSAKIMKKVGYENAVMVVMEKPIATNKSWCTKFIPRGSLTYSFSRTPKIFDPNDTYWEYTIHGKTYTKKDPYSMATGDFADGMILNVGFGWVIKKFTLDFAFNFPAWGDDKSGLTGPPIALFTTTVDLH